MRIVSGSIVHDRSKKSAEVLWVWLSSPGARNPPLIDIAFVIENAEGWLELRKCQYNLDVPCALRG